MGDSDNFVPFGKDHFPKLGSYGGMLLPLLYVAYSIRKDIAGYKALLEPFAEIKNNSLAFDEASTQDFLATLESRRALEGPEFFELLPASAEKEHIYALRSMGCNITVLKLSEASQLGLKNYLEAVNGKFDITFSNALMEDNSGISDGVHSKTFRSMEMYALFSNITKQNGYSIHAGGNYVSTLYSTLLDFLGFRIIKYFKFASGENDSVLILKKYNSKETSYEEFDYLYQMMKARDALRYR
ncbi:MAG: hypothetical protein V1702_04185 [Candidatus Woesearchaeota archaeon]